MCFRIVLIGLALTLVVAGCTSEAPGQALPVTSDATPTSPPPSRGGKAPPINSPELDLASYESRVCDLLTPAQLAPFAIHGTGKAKDGPAGPACTWNPPDTSAGARIDLAILSKAQNGWEGIYERRGSFAFFEEVGDINGYPAVHRDVDGDQSAEGVCFTAVGARADLVFDVVAHVNVRSSPEYKDACSVSDRVAGLVIDTLRGGR